MKQISIAGRVGRDAVTRTTQGGDSVTSFSVAVSDRAGTSGKDAPPVWFECSLWGERGKRIASYIRKGSKLAVSGELTVREHEGRTYLGVRVDSITLMGGREDRDERPTDRPEPRGGGRPSSGHDLDDEIPFGLEWR